MSFASKMQIIFFEKIVENSGVKEKISHIKF